MCSCVNISNKLIDLLSVSSLNHRKTSVPPPTERRVRKTEYLTPPQSLIMSGAAGSLIQVAMMTHGKSRRAIYALCKVIIVDFDSYRAACFYPSLKK